MDFVNEVSRLLKIERKDLVEKDIILHQILLDLSENKFFIDNYLFKGGTCLIKCYLGYYRFSEDIDFTWKKQKQFKGMSQKEIRRHLSGVINKTGQIFEEIAKKRGFDFKCNKNDRKYTEFGGGDKTTTFKIWYDSEILKRKTFLKVQINFVEKLLFPARKRKLKSLLTGSFNELNKLFPSEYKEYLKQITFETYDLREITCEKTRAILTRRGIKARDFVDVYFALKKLGIKAEFLEKEIIEKINIALNLYAKYKNNFKDKKKLLQTGQIFTWGDERNLLLSEIDEKGFYMFLEEFTKFLQNVSDKVEID